MWLSFFLWSRNLDQIYFCCNIQPLYINLYIFYFILLHTYRICIHVLRIISCYCFPKYCIILVYVTLFYIYFTIASRKKNHFQSKYDLFILNKSFLKNYKKNYFFCNQLKVDWNFSNKHSLLLYNKLLHFCLFDNKIINHLHVVSCETLSIKIATFISVL